MKTTIELDEEKLDKIMKMTGIRTMKEAVDWALNEAVRIATINHIMENPGHPRRPGMPWIQTMISLLSGTVRCR